MSDEIKPPTEPATPPPAPAVASDKRLAELVAQLTARVESLEQWAATQGAELNELKAKAATQKLPKPSRFFR